MQDVATDAAGAGFPYKPQGVWELLGEASGFTDASGGTVTLEELRASSDVLGLYFSASWCGACVRRVCDVVLQRQCYVSFVASGS